MCFDDFISNEKDSLFTAISDEKEIYPITESRESYGLLVQIVDISLNIHNE